VATDEGYEILRRAIETATARRASDYAAAVAKGPQRIPELRHVAANLKRAVDAAGMELAVLGLNGIEVEAVLRAIIDGLIPPPYFFDGE
jgi:hypothetical protein